MVWFSIILLLVQVAIGEVFRPKPKGADLEKFSGPTASEARPVPVLWGTGKIRSPNVLWNGDYLWRDITEVVKSGIIGTHKQIKAYSYFQGLLLGVCMGRIDRFRQILSGDKVLHQTNLAPFATFFARCVEKSGRSFYIPNLMSNAPNDLIARCDVLGGDDTQNINAYLVGQTDANISAFRRITSLMIYGPTGNYVDIAGYVPLPPPDPVDPPCPLGLPCPAGENERPPLSTWCPSGNVGIANGIQPYSIIASRWPRNDPSATPPRIGIPEGNGYVTSGSQPNQQMHMVCYGAKFYQGLINMYTDPHLPAASPANKGQFWIVSAASPGAMQSDGTFNPATPISVTYQNTCYGTSTPWYLADMAISDGKTWYRSVGFEANPAEMIYEVLTGEDDFCGLPVHLIDNTSFQLAAKQLYDEGFGLMMIFEQKIKGRALIAEILRHIDAVLYMDVSTGRYKLKLIRGDYTVAALIAAGKIFNESNIKELTNYGRAAWDETINEVKVLYTDSAQNFVTRTAQPVQDLANINIQEDIITSTPEYPGITSPRLANIVAYRDLKAMSFPLGRANFTANRKLFDLGPGDVFIFQWAALGIDQLVMRISKRKENDMLDGTIEIEAIQDVFSLGESAYQDIDPGGGTDTTGAPALITIERALATPFFFTQDNAKASPMALAVRPNNASFRYNVYQRLASVTDYSSFDPQPAFVPSGLLMFNYSKSAGLVAIADTAAVDTQPWDLNSSTPLVLQSPKDLNTLPACNDNQIAEGFGIFLIDDEILAANWVFSEHGIGVHDLVAGGSANGTLTPYALSTAPVDEQWTVTAISATLFSVVGSVSGAQANATVGTAYDNGKISFTLNAGTNAFQAGDYFKIDVNTARNGTFFCYSVWRGLLDTVAADHVAGARAWFIGGGLGFCPTQFEPTDAIKLKLTARSVLAEMPVATATELSLTFNSEALRPYPPGNTKVNGLTWPVEITGQPTITWSERNRLAQLRIIKQDAATVSPESGTTYTVNFYKLANEATSSPFLAGTGSSYTLVKSHTGMTAGTVAQLLSQADELTGAGIAGGTRLSSHLRAEIFTTVAGRQSNQKQIRDFDCAGFDMLFDKYFDQ